MKYIHKAIADKREKDIKKRRLFIDDLLVSGASFPKNLVETILNAQRIWYRYQSRSTDIIGRIDYLTGLLIHIITYIHDEYLKAKVLNAYIAMLEVIRLVNSTLVFSDEKITLETTEPAPGEEFDEEVLHVRQLLKTKLVDMQLSVRALNCLKSAEVETLAELVVFNKTDLLKFHNFGKKSLVELEDLLTCVLTSLNLSFGMDISKYKLDKE